VPVADLAALHDALSCCATAADQTWRGDIDSASLSLLEANVAAEEAFGRGSPVIEALNVVFAAIKQAAGRDVPPPRPASDQSRLGQERALTTNPTMTTSPPSAPSLHEILERVRMANCGECWQELGSPCATGPDGADGYHVARLSGAMRRGLISGRELVGVLQALVTFDNATVVYDVAPAVV
jgi:hypothetical protein